MAIILMINLKGGVAKTTNAVAVAECFADEGRQVLLIDADHQCMASEMLLGEERLLRCEKRGRTLHDMLAAMLDDEFEEESVPYFVEEGGSNIGSGYANLHVLPCSLRIDDFEKSMRKSRNNYRSSDDWIRDINKKRRRLRNYLSTKYDYTIVDCPPALAIQLQVLVPVADAFVIPSIPDQLSIRGSMLLLDRLRRANFSKVRPLGMLWSLYRQQARAHREAVERAARGTPPFDQLPRPFETVIPNASKIADSTDPSKNFTSYYAKYTPAFARLYQNLCGEIRKRVNSARQ